jgi:hypothetical protein
LVPALAEGPMIEHRTGPERRRRIVYWAFNIEITGPRYRSKSEDRRIHRILSRKLLKQIEEVARLAVQAKLPPGFEVKVY